MLSTQSPVECRSWNSLTHHFLHMQAVHLRELFAEDPERFSKFHVQFEDILVDYSKNIITDETLNLLTHLAQEQQLSDAIKQMYEGVAINATEGRPVLHIALRNRSNTPILVEGKDVMPEVNRVLNQIQNFSNNFSKSFGIQTYLFQFLSRRIIRNNFQII